MATRTRTQIASKIKLQNIVSLVQTNLEENFKLVVESMDDQEDKIINLNQRSNKTDQKLNQLQNNMEKIEKQNSQFKNDISELKKMMEEMQKRDDVFSQKNSNFQKGSIQNPESQLLNNQLQSFKDQIAKINKQKINESNNRQQFENRIEKQIQKLRSELKRSTARKNSTDQNSTNSSLNKSSDQMQKNLSVLKNDLKNLEKQLYHNNQRLALLQKPGSRQGQMYDKVMNKVMEKLQQFKITQYNPFKSQTSQKIEDIFKRLDDLNNELSEQQKLRNKFTQQQWKLSDILNNNENAKINQEINSDNIRQLKRQIADIYKKMNQLQDQAKYSGFNQTTLQSPSKNIGSTGQEGDIRAEFINRLKDLKNQLLRALRKSEMRKDGGDQSDKARISELQQRVLRLQHILGDKADITTVKKMIAFLESKISYVFNIVTGNQNEDDACIARKPWVCLSCDKKLDKYQGKIGSHLVTSQLKSKVLQQETLGGGMALKHSKSKYQLPNVRKISQESQRFQNIKAKK